MKIRIRRKKLPEWLVLYIWVMPFVLPLFLELLRLPSVLKYTLDIAWILLLFIMAINRMWIPNVQMKTLTKIIGIFFGITLVGLLINYQSILYYLWGFRNNFRFFVFFLTCVLFLSFQSAEKCLALFDSFFWVNFPVVLIQYFLLHKKQDYIGGIFGTQVGCNGYLNILLVIVVAKSILNFWYRKEKLFVCLLKCIAALIVAVVSELKVFFVEFLLIIFMITLMTKFSFRRLVVVILCVVGTIIGARLVPLLFPDFAGWFSVDGILKIIASDKGYTHRNDINRLNAISYAMDRFLPAFHNKLFGLGLGNCDYATFEFLTTPFYRAHKWTNYVWFSSAFLVLETGIVGLAVYISFFVTLYFCAGKVENTNTIYCKLAQVIAVMSVVMVMYNAAMRTEAGYMVYFILALPFIKNRAHN